MSQNRIVSRFSRRLVNTKGCLDNGSRLRELRTTPADSLKQRDIGFPDVVTSDAHDGLKATLRATFNAIPRLCCHFHLQQNAQVYIPSLAMRAGVDRDTSAPSLIHQIFQALRPVSTRLLRNTKNQHQKSPLAWRATVSMGSPS